MKKQNLSSYDKKKILSSELIEINEWYALTISPLDQYQSYDCKNRILQFRKNMNSHFFEPLADVSHLKGCIEISRTGRLHFHGVILWNNYKSVLDTYLNLMPLILSKSNIKLDTINDMPKWVEYYTKSNRLFINFITYINIDNPFIPPKNIKINKYKPEENNGCFKLVSE